MEDYGITNEQLKEFCEWYVDHFQKKETFTGGMSISAAGYFHLSNKDAGKLLDRCNSIGLIKKRRENIVILVGDDVVREPQPAEPKRAGRPKKECVVKPKRIRQMKNVVTEQTKGNHSEDSCLTCRHYSTWAGRQASGFCLRRKQGVRGSGFCGFYEKE